MKTPKDGLKRPAKLDKFDYQDEREILLLRVRSFHSGRAYRMALERLEAWCAREGIIPKQITTAPADDWIQSEKGEDSPATVRLRVSGARSVR